MTTTFASFNTGLALPAELIIIGFFAGILAFEIWMFAHVCKNHFISPEAKALWIFGMLILHPIVAIIYYFSDYHKGEQK